MCAMSVFSLGVDCDALKAEALKKLKGDHEAETPKKRKVRLLSCIVWLLQLAVSSSYSHLWAGCLAAPAMCIVVVACSLCCYCLV